MLAHLKTMTLIVTLALKCQNVIQVFSSFSSYNGINDDSGDDDNDEDQKFLLLSSELPRLQHLNI